MMHFVQCLLSAALLYFIPIMSPHQYQALLCTIENRYKIQKEHIHRKRINLLKKSIADSLEFFSNYICRECGTNHTYKERSDGHQFKLAHGTWWREGEAGEGIYRRTNEKDTGGER